MTFGGIRLRTALLALLALLVPLPALALNGDSGDPGADAPVEIAVSVGLGDCGLAEAQIVCELDATWSAVEEADYYTVSVTRADGSVVDYGQSTGTAMSMWVPYVGAGSYSVQVSAWGTPDDEDKATVIARDRAFSSSDGDATGGDGKAGMDSSAQPGAAEGGHASGGEPPPSMGTGGEPGVGNGTDASEEPPPAPEPVCEEPPPAPEPPPADGGGADESGSSGSEAAAGVAPETAGVSAETQAALEDQAELPDSVSCP